MAPAQTESYECPNCGANLDPSLPSGHEVFTVRCEYCGKKIRLKKAPGPSRAGRPQLIVKPRRSNIKAVLLVVGCVVLLLFVGLGVTLCSVARRAERAGRALVGDVVPGGGGASLPRRCSGSGQIVINNETLHHAGPLVEASGSCRVMINNANLTSGEVALVVSGGAKVNIANSNISGAAGAIRASGDARVAFVNGSVSSRGTAVLAEGKAEVSLVNCRLSGVEAAYATKGQGKVTTTGTTVEGPVPSPQP